MEHPLLDENKYLEFAEKIVKSHNYSIYIGDRESRDVFTVIALALLDIAKTLKEKK